MITGTVHNLEPIIPLYISASDGKPMIANSLYWTTADLDIHVTFPNKNQYIILE